MLITNPHELAQALRPILKEQVVVRYSVSGLGSANFYAELAVLGILREEELLNLVTISADFYRHTAQIRTSSRTKNLTKEPGALVELCQRWNSRCFDDWRHGEPFMGAYEVYRDGMPHTSIKLDALDNRWSLLTGIALAEVEKFASTFTDVGEVDRVGTVLMRRRFSAFVAQTTLAWARCHLTAG